jgi:uncharacterized membrane protein (DUF2068 family)
MAAFQLSTGLRAVAVFEATKGTIALAAACGLLALLPKGGEAAAREIARHMHLNAGKDYARIFVDLAQNITDTHLWLIALLALTYSVARFIEAYGLWRARPWAEWVAVVSGGIYIPFELYEISLGLSAIKFAAFALNIGVVGYMVHALRTKPHASALLQPQRR